MEKQHEGQWVVPNPQIPRSFGLMNILFGVILLLLGAGQLALSYYSPKLFKWVEDRTQQQLEEAKAKRQAKIKELTEKVKTAKTEEEKKDIELELNALQSAPELNPAMFDEMKKLQHDRRLLIYNYSEMSAGIVLNVIMIVSGVGLVALAEWARRLAIVTAWLKIARWTAMTVATIFVILPITTEAMQPLNRSIQAQTTGRPGGPPSPSMVIANLTQISVVISVVSSIGTALVASVYPACLVWFLTRPPARAACMARSPSQSQALDRELPGS